MSSYFRIASYLAFAHRFLNLARRGAVPCFVLAVLLLGKPGRILAQSQDYPTSLEDARDVASQQQSVSLEQIGHLGGDISAVAVQGSYAYVGSTYELAILDISLPTDPRRVGYVLLPEWIEDIHVAGDYVYVADGSAGLQVVRVTDRSEPRVVGTYDTPGAAKGIDVSLGHAYVAHGGTGGLQIISVSPPEAPTPVGAYATSGQANDVAVAEDYAYVADGSTVEVVDVSSPGSPTSTGSFSSYYSGMHRVVLADSKALVADTSGLVVLDISNPEAPSEIGFNGPTDRTRDVAVAGSYAYVAAEGAGLWVYDVSGYPTYVGEYDTPGTCQRVVVSGSTAWLADGDALRLIDVLSPGAPSESGAFYVTGSPTRITVNDGTAYVADSGYGLKALDLSDETNPRVTGRLEWPALDGGDTIVASANDVAVEDAYAYVPTGDLVVADVSDPNNLAEVGRCTGCGTNGVDVAGNRAYVTGGYSLSVVDVSDPGNPSSLGAVDLRWGYARDVVVSDTFAYVANGTDGLQIVDVGNPNQPTAKGIYEGIGDAYAVDVVGDMVYVADIYGELVIVDVSDPDAPTRRGYCTTPGDATDVVVASGRAYVANGWDGVRVIDVSNPASPQEIGSHDIPWYANGVAVDGDTVYVTDPTGGVFVLALEPRATVDVADPANEATLNVGETSITFPAGTFAEPAVVTYTKVHRSSVQKPVGDLYGIGHFFTMTATSKSTGQPIQPVGSYSIAYSYTDEEKGTAIEATLAFYYWDGSGWAKEPTSVVDTSARTVRATPSHFSQWAVLGETRRVLLPLVLRQR